MVLVLLDELSRGKVVLVIDHEIEIFFTVSSLDQNFVLVDRDAITPDIFFVTFNYYFFLTDYMHLFKRLLGPIRF